MQKNELPIWAIIPSLLRALAGNQNAIVIAPPGSGKTTQIPPALVEAFGRQGVTVVVQPRRVACRAVAVRVAEEMGVELGSEVGYIVRYDTKVSPKTKLLFVTDGVLLRLLEKDRRLSWATTVILDEFHERRMNVDLLLGFLKQAQKTRTPPLHLVVMSATIQADRVAAYLNAQVFCAEGRAYPVDIRYDERPSSLKEAMTVIPDWVLDAYHSPDPGDVLVFLPGKEEIRRVQRAIEALKLTELIVLPLHGELSKEAQDLVFQPQTKRKIILSTNVAETSVTIPGVTRVIDSGFERRAAFDPHLRIDRLDLERISLASADQRAGRAGRERRGSCIRLWSTSAQRSLIPHPGTEIQRLELSSTVLTLKLLGIHKPESFEFLDPPEAQRLKMAEEFLTELGALDETGVITRLGQLVARFPLSPRYARIVVEGMRRGCLNEMATIAALMVGRPVFLERNRPLSLHSKAAFAHDTSSDFFPLLVLFQSSQHQNDDFEEWCDDHGICLDALNEAARLRYKILSVARSHGSQVNRQPTQAKVVRDSLLVGLFDLVAKRQPGGTYRLSNGMICTRDSASVVEAELVLAADVHARHGQARSAISQGVIQHLTRVDPILFESLIESRLQVIRVPTGFDVPTQALLVRREARYRDLVLRWEQESVPQPEAQLVLLHQQARAQAGGWQRVEVLPGINRCGAIIWNGKRVPVETDGVGPYWALVEPGPTTLVSLQERIVEIPTVTPPSMRPELAQRLQHLSPVVSKILHRRP